MAVSTRSCVCHVAVGAEGVVQVQVQVLARVRVRVQGQVRVPQVVVMVVVVVVVVAPPPPGRARLPTVEKGRGAEVPAAHPAHANQERAAVPVLPGVQVLAAVRVVPVPAGGVKPTAWRQRWYQWRCGSWRCRT